jgi:hypothetical protein
MMMMGGRGMVRVRTVVVTFHAPPQKKIIKNNNK